MAEIDAQVVQMFPMIDSYESNMFGEALVQTLSISQSIGVSPKILNVSQTLILWQSVKGDDSVINVNITQTLGLTQSASKGPTAYILQNAGFTQLAKGNATKISISTLDMTQTVGFELSNVAAQSLDFVQTVTFNQIRNLAITQTLDLSQLSNDWFPYRICPPKLYTNINGPNDDNTKP